MHTVAIANQKGGSGKTSVATHLAAGLASQKRRVLLVDLDYQQNATRWMLGRAFGADEPGAPDVLATGRRPKDELYEAPGRPGLWLLPATERMQIAEATAATMAAGQMNLRRALRAIASRFDHCVIDCAPNLNVATLAGLCAAEDILVPIPPAYLSLVGLSGLETTAARIREGFSVDTRVSAYSLFAVDTRESLAVATREILRKSAGAKLLRAEVRISTQGKQLPDRRTTAWEDGEDERGQVDYRALLAELLVRWRQ
jgi:chromosome partitioning protein